MSIAGDVLVAVLWQHELQRAELDNAPRITEGTEEPQVTETNDPWKQADESKGDNPIESATIKPR